MRYAITNQFGFSIEFINGKSPIPVGAAYPIPKEFEDFPKKYLKIVDGKLLEKSTEEKKEADNLSLKFENQKEVEFQNNKSQQLKLLENIYINFLKTIWINTLRKNNIINTKEIIDEHTEEARNINYLMQLRSLDFSDYLIMAGEFDRLKYAIISNGGDMKKISSHNI